MKKKRGEMMESLRQEEGRKETEKRGGEKESGGDNMDRRKGGTGRRKK